MTVRKTVSTGSPCLDDLLDGGIPPNRVVLLTGGPGTGKSTLGMQFLQEGLDRGERCLFVSTEETPAEMRATFHPYDFDFDHENLSIVTVAAVPGQTFEADGETLTLRGRDETGPSSADFTVPFDSRNVTRFLEGYGPVDRIVIDSVSGMAAMTEQEPVSRRLTLALIRLVTDAFDSTALFIDEDPDDNVGSTDALWYNAHGILRLWNERIDGDFHRFLQVVKMRGVDHDTGVRKFVFHSKGLRVLPGGQTRSTSFISVDYRSTGVSGLDDLMGGGLIGGSTALLEHDGRAEVEPLVITTLSQAIEDGETIVLFPSASMDPDRFDRMLLPSVGSVESLLANDQLFVLDFVGTWEDVHPNAFNLGDRTGLLGVLGQQFKLLYHQRIMRATQKINERRGDRPALSVLHTESLLQHLTPTEIRQMYYWAKQNLLHSEDRVLFIQNPGVMDEKLAEFYAYDAEQILYTWLHEGGLQFIKLEKSPSGKRKGTRLVTHVEEPPYVAVECPDHLWEENANEPIPKNDE